MYIYEDVYVYINEDEYVYMSNKHACATLGVGSLK